MPLKEGEILRLKKDTNNIMVGFGKYDKIVKFIAIQYQ